mmetsp:Transcript_18195/g.44679  ORF Transcript_18195/g.44679 Transcript_18195/m.44679 type:complete len:399 (+) Transcript_18195:138-1334(+)
MLRGNFGQLRLRDKWRRLLLVSSQCYVLTSSACSVRFDSSTAVQPGALGRSHLRPPNAHSAAFPAPVRDRDEQREPPVALAPEKGRHRLIKMQVEYDGTMYCGWQSQISDPKYGTAVDELGLRPPKKKARARKDQTPTVQDSVEEAIWRLTGETVRTRASSRTDAGVHALGQVCVFNTLSQASDAELLRGINTRLPKDVCVRRLSTVPSSFDPRKSTSKMYRYCITHGCPSPAVGRAYSWHVRDRLDVQKMQEAANHMVGRDMDFTSFASRSVLENRDDRICRLSRLSVRAHRTVGLLDDDAVSLDLDVGGDGRQGSDGMDGDDVGVCERQYIIIECVANRFMHNMCRIIVGHLVEVGKGAAEARDIPAILAAKNRDACTSDTAPAKGLMLVWVRFEN